MLHFDDIVFGPIFSRRLGSSLGVNILPTKGKLCNFDCIYCECGWNKDGKSDGRFPRLAEVEAALEEKMSKAAAEGVPVDSITFSGNGEPTMNPDFPQIVEATVRLRDRYFPQAKVSVLSNAVLVARQEIADALKKVDNPILKVDAATDSLVKLMNRPSGHYRLEEVVKNLKSFGGNFILQTMFLRSPEFDLSISEALEGWYEIVRETRPREIMVYTIDRETPDKSLGKYTIDEMKSFVAPLEDEGFKIQIRG
jgi:wyosine [tRNA(Phe)-imidazoG37] synthetase (radical SAM superfamily)